MKSISLNRSCLELLLLLREGEEKEAPTQFLFVSDFLHAMGMVMEEVEFVVMWEQENVREKVKWGRY
ncbi:hypothetical protein A2U01_0017906 [Trifolium medium]|uniref:Uncharacterized protein n=1 Tax=Trifolium medium TaxID=97028 RepID=A0A392NCT2_9FABA|nr:hypothetical protein [Trifolium medium]